MYMQPSADSKMWLSCYRDINIKPKEKKKSSGRGQAIWKPDTKMTKSEVFTQLAKELAK